MAAVTGVFIFLATFLASLSSCDANYINGTSEELASVSIEDFITTYGKTYENEAEAKKRIAIFLENYRVIMDHNKLYESGKSTFRMGINEFSDMTFDEVVSQRTGAKKPSLAERHESYPDELYVPKDLGKEPEYLDYRDMGALNPIRDQGTCLSCWAFTLVASIESSIFIKVHYLLQLSEQDLLDCCEECSYKEGCDGGRADVGIIKVRDEGIAYREEYAYTADDGTCKDVQRVYPVQGMKRIRHYNDSELLNALVQMGPIIISMHVTKKFQQYRNRIFVDDLCLSESSDHAMLLVGYGTEDGQDYWLLRNSWGKSWGEEGYIKMARNVKNDCGISYNAYFPVIKEQ